MLTLLEYQNGARATKVYDQNIIYPALGLGGEFGELGGAIRGMSQPWTYEVLENIKKEIGDVLWYVANLCSDLGLKLHDCMGDDEDGTFDRIVYTVMTDNAYMDATPVVGRILESVKKSLRDDRGVITESRRQCLEDCIHELVCFLGVMSNDYGFTLEQAALLNLKKLRDRQQRAVLQGEGDNR